MEKMILWLKSVAAIITGLFSWVYGGLDVLLAVLIVCIVIDYITGILSAIYTKTLNSRVGFRGILKKVAILMVVALGSLLGTVLGNATVRDAVIGFYVANECISILENAGRMDVPIVERLVHLLEQLKDEFDGKEE